MGLFVSYVRQHANIAGHDIRWILFIMNIAKIMNVLSPLDLPPHRSINNLASHDKLNLLEPTRHVVEKIDVEQMCDLASEERTWPWNRLELFRFPQGTPESMGIDSIRNHSAPTNGKLPFELYAVVLRVGEPERCNLSEIGITPPDMATLIPCKGETKPIVPCVKHDRNSPRGQLHGEPGASDVHSDGDRSVHPQPSKSLKEAQCHLRRAIGLVEPGPAVQDLSDEPGVEILEDVATPGIAED